MQFTEEALFKLKFDGKELVNELGELEKRLHDVKEAQKTVERGTKEWAENKKEIAALTAQIKVVREEMGAAGLTVRQLEQYARDLNREIKDLTPGTDAYIKKTDELKDVNNRLATHREGIRGVNQEVDKQPSLWERAKNAMGMFLVGFAAVDLIQRFFSFIQGGIQSALSLSDMMSSVAKATNQSTEEVAALSEEIDKIDTRTKKEDLMAIAEVGGQLGVANDELLGFVDSMDKVNVALGKEFPGGVEEASNKLGTLQKLFKETKDLKAGEAINHIGSAINELGADGSATAPVIAEFTARMGQLGDLSPQITQTMGLGAAFQELGLSAEISAGGLSNILLTAAKDTYTFAQQLNISEKEMKKLINTNPNEFLLRLAESLRGVPADQLASRLDQLGIKSQEATKVMALLKDQTDMVRQKQDLANKSFQQGTSLQNEFNKMNSNAAAEYAKSQKALAQLATEIGQSLLPGVVKVTQGVIGFVNILRAVPGFVSDNRTALTALGVAVLAFNSNLIAATASSLAHQAMEKARLIWTQAATTAQNLLNTAMRANPIGLVITAVSLLVAGFVTLYNNSQTVRAGINGIWQAMKTAATVAVEFVKAFLSMDIKGMATAMLNGGKQIADSFNKGYADQLASERPKQQAAHQKHLDTKKAASQKTASEIANLEVIEDGKTHDRKAKQAEKHREQELKKAKKAADDEAKEKVQAEKDAQKSIADLSIAAIKDEEQRQIASLRLKNQRELEQVALSKASSQTKAVWEQSLNEQLERDIAKVQEDHRKKKADDEENKRKERVQKEREASSSAAQAEYELAKQSLDNQLQATNLNVSTRRKLKLDLIDLEKQEELRKIKEVADREREQAKENVTALEAIDRAQKAQEQQAENAHQQKKKEIEQQSLAERKANQQAWFDAIKGLMNGDFQTFSDLLMQKLQGEKKMLTEAQQANVDKIDKIGQYAQLGAELLQKISEARLQKELKNIDKEKKAQLKSWEEKYKQGLIDKSTYEKGIDKINKDADAKVKEAKLTAWKREQRLNIAMALINAAMAALKSLATMGFPLGLIGVAASAAMAAIQIGIIKSQKPPDFAKGGYIRNAGVAQGPGHGSRYGESGIALVRRDTNEEVGEMEGNEPIMILSQNTYRHNRPIIDKLLHSSLHRNGAPIYSQGGIVGSDGGSYRDYLEPLRYGSSYLFGTKKKKREAEAAAAEAQREADAAMSEASSAGSGYDGGDGDYGYAPDDEFSSATGSSADGAVSMTNQEIEKSQQLMNNIAKNTGKTVEKLDSVIQELEKVNNGIGTANGYLERIAAKDLSVSVHNVVNVMVQVETVKSDSDFK
mgnify:CR=1 FL=1